MAQIQAKWANSQQNSPNPGKMGQIWLKNLNFDLNSNILVKNPHRSLRDPDPDLWDPDSDLQDLGSSLNDLNPSLRD